MGQSQAEQVLSGGEWLMVLLRVKYKKLLIGFANENIHHKVCIE